ncbi:sensor histidine kinase [Changpingibacter yushuensis]|uniref:sensor histidine kinase n=1 Tax=Changpingibacter yushuensis TaxID=2758440 RepID=UPI0021CDA7C1|nr:histidine kinase [Changpingibacter yushuensis]
MAKGHGWRMGRRDRGEECRTPEAVASLTESRREIVAAFEIERRRIERDLHDGAQQYLVTASMSVGEADLLLDSVTEGHIDADVYREVKRLLAKAQDDSDAALRALRQTVAGIHPKVLSDIGLEAAVRDLASSSPMNVLVRVPIELPTMTEGVIAAGYFLVSEALTNVAKYAPDAGVSVLLAADDELRITVVDEGPGGASITPDHGLAGMKERLAAFGGSLDVISPLGGPTTVSGRIPLLLRNGEFGVAMSTERKSA